MKQNVSPISRMISAKAVKRLLDAGCESPQREAQMIFEHVQGDEARFEELLKRREAREPLSQILGERGFWEHDFIVNEHVLTPRPDSEVLIEEALKCLPNKEKPYRFLDLGTGSGCLILTLLHEFPNASAVAVDKSPEALAVANRNAQKLGFQNRVEFQQADWAESLTEGFDLVISNPPYIPMHSYEGLMPEVRDHEPIMALVGGEDGLEFYRTISAQAPAILQQGGWLIFEVGIGQTDQVAALAEQNGFDLHKIRKDYGGIERAVILQKR
ncbi:MAG: peptide chain release factor N(5)-glutamine methyltransferase [Rickettsiales bacterium]|nr:peptide chain release factor N(5)-glutamine methyltransferase [Rickettsiales bacterium]